jgi:hypothetical protein
VIPLLAHALNSRLRLRVRSYGGDYNRERCMSVILVGFGKKTYRHLGETGLEQSCVWCSGRVFYHLVLGRTWFTYFFVPLFSYGTEYRVECPLCGCGVRIFGDEVKAARRGELSLHKWPD